MINRHKICVYGATGKVGVALVSQLKRMKQIDVITSYSVVTDADLYFMCTDAAVSKSIVERLPADARIIDFSPAFREDAFVAGTDWRYGQIANPFSDYSKAKCISVAGCIASSIELILLPLPRHHTDLFITTFVGRSAATTDVKTVELRHVYDHPHNREIMQYIGLSTVDFVPVVGQHETGITTVCQLKACGSLLYDRYVNYYENDKTVIVERGDASKHQLSRVVGRNRTLITLYETGDKTAITCSIDNLYRGSSSHGIELMKKMLKIK